MPTTNPPIQPNSTITGPALPEPVEGHAVTPMGTAARIMGVGRRKGSPFNAVLTADQLAALEVLTDGVLVAGKKVTGTSATTGSDAWISIPR